MKKNYQFRGKQIPGEEVEFEIARENFNSYFLADGSKLKLKAVVTSIVRLDAHNPDGNPVYMINSSTVVATDCPPGLMRKPGQ